MKLISIACVSILCALVAGPVRADTTGRDAGKHFARGVELYNDGDFRGALVEFKRAYTLLPRANVLYDIGETEFQLQDYAAALVTMRRFLAETGATAPHRAEVEATVETLRGRVGKIALSTDVAHCEVALDDQPAGTTPLADAMSVSIGPRKIAITCPDRPVATRRVEVAAGEMVRLEVLLGPALTVAPREVAPRPSLESIQRRQRGLLALSWTTTALFAAATLGVGTATLVESSQLGALRQTYPVQAETIGDKASLTRSLSIAADSLGVAALAAIGVSTYVTVRYRKEKKMVLGFGLGAQSATVRGTF